MIHRLTLDRPKAARAAGVSRVLYSSSCSLYGAAGNGLVDEEAPFNPVTRALGDSTDPAQWSDYATALAAYVDPAWGRGGPRV